MALIHSVRVGAGVLYAGFNGGSRRFASHGRCLVYFMGNGAEYQIPSWAFQVITTVDMLAIID